MFKILDGREFFYQWDSQQKLIVEDVNITEVHYCNRTDDCSLVCKVYELDGKRVADVPNILLQDNWKIRVYAFTGVATKIEEDFKVYPRTKPDDYIYTETEVLNYDSLDVRVTALEEAEIDLTGYATEEYVDEAIENSSYAYFTQENGRLYYNAPDTNDKAVFSINEDGRLEVTFQ